MWVAGILSQTCLGWNKSEQIIAPQLLTPVSRAGHWGSRTPASSWAPLCHQQSLLSQPRSARDGSPLALASLGRVTSPTPWCFETNNFASRCRDSHKGFHRRQRGKNLGMGQRQDHHRSPHQLCECDQGAEPSVEQCSLVSMCWIFNVASTAELSSVCFSNLPHLYF